MSENKDKEPFRKGKKEFKKWKSTIEEIYYDLAIFGDTAIADEEDKILIAKTLLKLPDEVRRNVLDNVRFVMMGSADGTVHELSLTPFVIERLRSLGIIKAESSKDQSIKLSTLINADIKMPLIFLNFTAMWEQDEFTKMSTIAHEIAHFVLGHHKSTASGGREREKEADDLTEKWGFKRSYKSYNEFPSDTK